METEPYQQYPWLQFAPELPTFGEFFILVFYTACVLLVGKLLKNYWEKDRDCVPIPVALAMGVFMIALYAVLIAVFYNRTPDSHKVGILVWCMIAVIFPLFYYGLIVVNSFASRAIDRVSPFGMQIHEPSEFAEARKMALRGDVDGAVKRYRAYLDNTDGALFEAARLLKSEDRFAEAAALFQEITERYFGKKIIWAEATYHLAKLREGHLHQANEAKTLLDQIIERTPDSRFGQLAHTELIRIGALYGASVLNGNNAVLSEADDPFFDEQDQRAAVVAERPEGKDNGRAGRRSPRKVDMDDIPIPPVDPFYAAALRNREASAAEEAATSALPKAAEKTKSAAKKPATKKKAAAKKKPAAKRKPKSDA